MLTTLIRDLLGRTARADVAEPGWATASLEQSLRRAVMALTAALPLVMCATLVVAAPRESQFWVTAGVFAVFSALAWACIERPGIPALLPLVANMVALAVVYAITPQLDHVVTFAAAWATNFASVAVVLLMRGWPGAVLAVCNGALCGIVLFLVHPDWKPTLTQGAPVTQTAIAICGLFGMRYFRSFAERADAQEAAAEQDRQAAAVAATASRTAAESARLLHDTVINTLGAIANGGRIISDEVRVRSRCARDIAAIEELLGDEEGARHLSVDWERIVEELGADVGVEAHVSLLIDAESQVVEQIPAATVSAVRGVLREALLNVAKHSGVGHASVDIEAHTDRLTIVVADDGIGLPADRADGFGIRESILARCREHGIGVRITTRPGQGTAVRLQYVHRTAPDAEDLDDDFTEIVAATQNRACWTWAWAVTAVGVAIEFTNHFGYFGFTWAMIGLLALVTGVAQVSCRGGRRISPIMQAVLILSTPGTFVLSLAGVGFGSSDVILWQLLGTTAPVIILLYQSRSVWPAAMAVLAHAMVGAFLVALLFHTSSVGIIVIGVLTPIVAVGGFVQFHAEVERIGAHAVAAQRAAARAREQLATREAVDFARSRWKVAGLHAVLDLLKRIVSAAADPTAPEIRVTCAAEERHLRQLLMLSPELLHLGYWFARASALARSRNIDLALRTGELDTPDRAVAEVVGHTILAEIAAIPAGGRVTVGLFPMGSGGVVTVVRDHCRDAEATPTSALDGVTIRTDVLGNQRVVEIAWAADRRAVALASV